MGNNRNVSQYIDNFKWDRELNHIMASLAWFADIWQQIILIFLNILSSSVDSISLLWCGHINQPWLWGRQPYLLCNMKLSWHIEYNSHLSKGIFFSCDQAALRTLLSVCPSVHLSVTPFSQCSCHSVIIKLSGVITIDKSDIHAKCEGELSKVKVTDIKTILPQSGCFQTVILVYSSFFWIIFLCFFLVWCLFCSSIFPWSPCLCKVWWYFHSAIGVEFLSFLVFC